MPNLNHCLDCEKPYGNPGVVCGGCSKKYRDIHETTQRLTYQIKKRKRLSKEK
jgi:hypothetical protein